ncbi:MAG: helix-turn-helix domain-containing protein [Acidobacteria bacterium]|nr:helix-turn-helix domain-containing protein [Acidobacteriota bacterium]
MPQFVPRPVPVTQGSEESTTARVGSFWITEAWFPSHAIVPPHLHDRTCLAVMLEGGFTLEIGGRGIECAPATVATEPAGERHANTIGGAGAHVVVLQPDPADEELNRACGGVLNEVRHFRHGGIALDARRLAREIHSPDAVSPLAMEALSLEILAATSRLQASDESAKRAPAWLARARDMLHAQFLDRPTVAGIAAEAGVHPVHLARVFKSHFQLSVGAYVRALRLEWAASRLAGSDDSLADIAQAAGFADQSHFTRAFRSRTGVTPQRYRSTARE